MPINIPIPSSSSITTYNFQDIADATGVALYYPAMEKDSAGVGYFLGSNTAFYSYSSSVSVTVPQAGTYANLWEQDFDVVLNTPRDVKGTVYYNIPSQAYGNIGGNVRWYFIVELYNVSGGTPTLIGSSLQGDSFTSGTGGTWVERMTALKDTLPRTHFKIGDTLRLHIEMWAYIAISGGTGSVSIGVDPANRELLSGGTYGARSTAFIPFKLNL